jgi:hypothetical protein
MCKQSVYLATIDGWVWWRGAWRRWVDSWPCGTAEECLTCLSEGLQSAIDSVLAASPNANEAVLSLSVRVYVSPADRVWIRAHPDEPGWQCALVTDGEGGAR